MSEDELRAWLVTRVSETLGVQDNPPNIDTPLDELGLSSRDAVMLAGDLEERLDRAIPPTIAWEYPSIRLLSAHLAHPPTLVPAGTDDVLGHAVPVAASLQSAESLAIEADSVADSTDDRIAIIGMACRLPGAVDSPAAFWRLLDEGTDAIGTVPPGRWAAAGHPDTAINPHGGFLADIESFDSEFFGITPREADLMDPQQRLVLEVAVEAIQHARHDPADFRGSSTGVFIGISSTEYGHLTGATFDEIEPWTATGAAGSIAANRVSYALDLRGPSLALDTACSSSLVALHMACASLRTGESSAALVGGVNLLLGPAITASFERAGALSPDGRCKAFSGAADGIGRGEGCGVILLKRLSDAQADGDRILGVVTGSAVNSDGRSNGLTAPNPVAQQAVLRRACAAAGLTPNDIDYIEAHGTGTILGDPIEAAALAAVFGASRDAADPLLIGSVKSNIGHLEAAAGIAAVIKVVLALGAAQLPASLHAEQTNPYIDFAADRLEVVSTGRAWPQRATARRAGVSGFGFGGTNAHVILEQAPDVGPVADTATAAGSPRVQVLALAAASDLRLQRAATDLADWLEHGAGRTSELPAVARSLVARQRSGSRHVAVAAADHAGMIAALRAVDTGQRHSVAADRPVWVFSGYGQQWGGMGRQLLQSEPAFAAAIDEVQPYLIEHAGVDIRGLLDNGVAPDGLLETMVTLFAVQIALAALWRAHGVEPAAVVGQSLGEVAAAVVTGGLSLADGARVISVRSRLMAEVEQRGVGAMALVGLSIEEFAALRSTFPAVEVAVYSSPEQCIVGGDHIQVEALIDHVDNLGRPAWSLRVGGAGHTSAVDPILSDLLDELSDVQGQPRADRLSSTDPHSTVPMYSTVSEDPRSEPAFDAAYWTANVRRPVRFAQAITAAVEDGFDTFVEISAHPVSAHAVRTTAASAGASKATVIASLIRDTDDDITFAENLGRLHASGHPTVLADRYPAGPTLDLPTGPWLRRQHWFRAVGGAGLPRTVPPTVRLDGHLAMTGGAHLWTGLSTEPNAPLTVASVLDIATEIARVSLPGAAVVSVALDGGAATDSDAEVEDGGAAQTLTTCSAIADGRSTVELFHSVAGTWQRVAHAELAPQSNPAPQSHPAAPSTPALPSVPESIPKPALDAAASGDSKGDLSPLAVASQLRSTLAEIMGHEADDLDPDVALIDLGFDSLMAARAQHAVQRDFGVALPVRLLLQGLNLTGLVAYIGETAGASIDTPAPVTRAAPRPSPAHADPLPRLSIAETVRGAAPDGFVPPRDPTERLLTLLWADVLGEQQIGVTDNFSARGGDAAAAARLVEAITERLGRCPDVTDLFEHPTVERMADLIRPDVEGNGSQPVRVLQPHGTRRPLFLFHPAGGPTSVYQPLVDRLDGQIPVYGMERLADFDTVETKAARYLELMRDIQPSGPYRVMGWSLGGLLATEVARQLVAGGEQVEFLASIDTIIPRDEDEPSDSPALLTARYQRFAAYVSETYGADMHIPDDIGTFDQATQMAMVYTALTDAGIELPAGVLQHQYTSYVDARIAESYVPKIYPGRMVLYRAMEVEALTAGLDPRYLRTDDTLGWDATVADLDVVRVPGHHITMIDPPNVDVLAAHLSAALAELDAAPSFSGFGPEQK